MTLRRVHFLYDLDAHVRWAEHPRTVYVVVRRRYEERKALGPVVEYALVPTVGEAVLVAWVPEADLVACAPGEGT